MSSTAPWFSQNTDLHTNVEDLLSKTHDWHSAVNVIFLKDGRLLLIRRSLEMQHHRGEIAFFGGRRESSEQDPKETAFREFYEESSFEGLEFRGYLDPVMTTRSQVVIPVVSKWNVGIEQAAKAVTNGEWDALYVLNLEKITPISQSFKVGTFQFGGVDRPIYFYPLYKEQMIVNLAKRDNRDLLWGATAKMIVENFDLLLKVKSECE